MGICEIIQLKDSYAIIPVVIVNGLRLYAGDIKFLSKACTAEQLTESVKDVVAGGSHHRAPKADFRSHMKDLLGKLGAVSPDLLFAATVKCTVELTGSGLRIIGHKWMPRYGHVEAVRRKVRAISGAGKAIQGILSGMTAPREVIAQV